MGLFVKPGNFWWILRPAECLFGRFRLARSLLRARNRARPLVLVFTPRYMAPEQGGAVLMPGATLRISGMTLHELAGCIPQGLGGERQFMKMRTGRQRRVNRKNRDDDHGTEKSSGLGLTGSPPGGFCPPRVRPTGGRLAPGSFPSGHVRPPEIYAETRQALARAEATSSVALEALEDLYLQGLRNASGSIPTPMKQVRPVPAWACDQPDRQPRRIMFRYNRRNKQRCCWRTCSCSTIGWRSK